NPPLQGDVTEHRWLLLIISSHASFDAIPLPNWVFPQPVQPCTRHAKNNKDGGGSNAHVSR
ncbi:MAG: hypothetical protein ABSF14_14660, partial [Terriglobia bacterium]